ncbi:IclR family transcriptional regulator C-terminal domain-containing protein [Dactylosporangium sp. NPDC005572]|uniref:IclR family transcriptional regulator domain-containing protein n=1 Tax=Dactylosporangium sp. NPDC005572 TaxID=3156889 RepID=UPI0033A77541
MPAVETAQATTNTDDVRVIDWPGEYVQSLDRGLAVIRSFTGTSGRLTIADVARGTGLTRASVRRSLHTLRTLGYVGSVDGRFFLQPRVLELGYAYLSSASIPVVAREHLVRLSERLRASCSMSVLDGSDILYVARAQTQRTADVSVGARTPAVATSMGRVLLAGLDDDALDERLDAVDQERWEPQRLREAIGEVRRQGFALVDQELVAGQRSVAAPVRDVTGRVVAAVAASDDASSVTLEHLRGTYRRELVQTARNISYGLAARG